MHLCDQICMTAVSSLLPALISRETSHLHKSWEEKCVPPMCRPLQSTPIAGGFMAMRVDINNLIHGMLFQGWICCRLIYPARCCSRFVLNQDSSLVSWGVIENLCLFCFVFFLKEKPYLSQWLGFKTCGFAPLSGGVLKCNGQFSFIWPSFMKSSV